MYKISKIENKTYSENLKYKSIIEGIILNTLLPYKFELSLNAFKMITIGEFTFYLNVLT